MMKYLLCNEREITERETAESEIEEIAERVRRERERGRVRAWEERGVKRALPARNAAHRSRPKTYLIFMNQGSEIQGPRSKVQGPNRTECRCEGTFRAYLAAQRINNLCVSQKWTFSQKRKVDQNQSCYAFKLRSQYFLLSNVEFWDLWIWCYANIYPQCIMLPGVPSVLECLRMFLGSGLRTRKFKFGKSPSKI